MYNGVRAATKDSCREHKRFVFKYSNVYSTGYIDELKLLHTKNK